MNETKLIQVRVNREVHRLLRIAAAKKEMSIRAYVEKLLEVKLKEKEVANA